MTLANPTTTATAQQGLSAGVPARESVVGRYRKRPVEIDAVPYNGDNSDAILRWVNNIRPGTVARTEHWDGACGHDDHSANRDLVVATLEDGTPNATQVAHVASPGDWIVCGTEGEFYPVKDSVFSTVYEAVDR